MKPVKIYNYLGLSYLKVGEVIEEIFKILETYPYKVEYEYHHNLSHGIVKFYEQKSQWIFVFDIRR